MGKTQFTIMEVIMIIVAYPLIFVLKCTRSITLEMEQLIANKSMCKRRNLDL